MWSASAEAGAGGATTARTSLLQELQNSRRRRRLPGSSGEEVESTLVTTSTSQRDASPVFAADALFKRLMEQHAAEERRTASFSQERTRELTKKRRYYSGTSDFNPRTKGIISDARILEARIP
mmetsp:Transcript_14479/g.32720  ORF Transcript_14479/g.32720 Transcript_14479/m.32720 type:complete len:123 (+) Transcript_14479:317-685(+)